jgi:hypothetical protein
LDFIVPYTASVRSLITSFIDAAKAGASWEEALAELDWDEKRNPQIFRQAKSNGVDSDYGVDRRVIHSYIITTLVLFSVVDRRR